MKATIKILKDRLLDIPGDMCKTKIHWIHNAELFLDTLTQDPQKLSNGLNFLMDYDMIADIREDGAEVWDYWEENGLLRGIRNRPLRELRA